MKKWCENILVVVMISTLIEMIFPDGKELKYLKVVIGIYLVFCIIEPILSYANNENFINDILKNNISEETYFYNSESQENYLNNIEKDFIENNK
jgi:stage III sporulation protein AF